jgi:predicted DNA-binding transcriptional regulator AlpA
MTMWRWRRDDPTFPKPISINGRLYFKRRELLAWLASKRAA